MQRVFSFAGSLALLSLCHCGGTASLHAAEQGKLEGLSVLVDGEVTRGELGKGEAVKLARAVARGDLRRAKGEAGVTTAKELGACVRALEEAFEERSQKEDEVAAAALLIRLEAGLAAPSEARKWFTAIPDGPRAAFRKVAARALIQADEGGRRRDLFVDPYEEVRLGALAAAGIARDPLDVEPLLEAARLDPAIAGRTQAIRSAGILGGERVVLALKDLWPQGDDAIREAITAAWAMPASFAEGGRRELAWVIETQKGAPALAAALTLVRTGGEGSAAALGVVERAIAAGPAKDRLQAIGGAPLSSAPLREALIKAEDDPDEVVKLAAASRHVEASAEEGGASAEERKKLGSKLLGLAASETKRVALGARMSLARAGFREVLPLVEKDLKSSDAQVRRSAGIALATLGELPRAARLVGDADGHVRSGVSCAILTADR